MRETLSDLGYLDFRDVCNVDVPFVAFIYTDHLEDFDLMSAFLKLVV